MGRRAVGCWRLAGLSKRKLRRILASPLHASKPLMMGGFSMSQSGDNTSGTIETLLHEERSYKPSAEFVAQANINDPDIYERAERDPEGYWREQARLIEWFREPTQTLEWNPPFAKWFQDGTLNASYNCLDRHLAER